MRKRDKVRVKIFQREVLGDHGLTELGDVASLLLVLQILLSSSVSVIRARLAATVSLIIIIYGPRTWDWY